MTTREVKLKFFNIRLLKLKNRFFSISNFQYKGLKRASLSHCMQVLVSDKKQMHTTCYAERIHICALSAMPRQTLGSS